MENQSQIIETIFTVIIVLVPYVVLGFFVYKKHKENKLIETMGTPREKEENIKQFRKDNKFFIFNISLTIIFAIILGLIMILVESPDIKLASLAILIIVYIIVLYMAKK